MMLLYFQYADYTVGGAMYYFIINPNSRSGAGRTIWNQLSRELTFRNVAYKAYLTEYVGHATEIAAQISRKGTPQSPVYLIAMGGDGTINEVLTGIADLSSVIFGYIPTGSGNDFCRGMKLPTDSLAALESILKEGRFLDMDVPYIEQNGRKTRFGISAGLGYDAAVCQEVMTTPAKKIFNRLKLGKLIYLFVALKQLLLFSPHPINLRMDGDREYSFSKVYFAAVMNQKYEGGGFMFCPNARPNDGVLDVILVEGLSRLKVLCCLPTAFFGRHTHFKGMHIFRCKSISFHSAAPVAIHKDGESGGLQCGFSVGLEKNTLKVIMPVL